MQLIHGAKPRKFKNKPFKSTGLTLKQQEDKGAKERKNKARERQINDMLDCLEKGERIKFCCNSRSHFNRIKFVLASNGVTFQPLFEVVDVRCVFFFTNNQKQVCHAPGYKFDDHSGLDMATNCI